MRGLTLGVTELLPTLKHPNEKLMRAGGCHLVVACCRLPVHIRFVTAERRSLCAGRRDEGQIRGLRRLIGRVSAQSGEERELRGLERLLSTAPISIIHLPSAPFITMTRQEFVQWQAR